MTQEQEIAPPPRFLLRPAGVLTQILCAFGLLLGTISFILVQQNKTGGAALVIAWAIAAMLASVSFDLPFISGVRSPVANALLERSAAAASRASSFLVLPFDHTTFVPSA